MISFLIDVLLDLSRCRFDFKIWGKYAGTNVILGFFIFLFGALIVCGWYSGMWVLTLLGLLGLGYVFYVGIRYANWWFREGRFGGEPPADIIPRGDLTSELSEEELLRSKVADIHSSTSRKV